MRRAGQLALCIGAAPGIVATAAAQTAPARVRGIVRDSIAGQPIVGAQVQFTSREPGNQGRVVIATTDSSGRYTIDAVSPGRYVAGFLHPSLDSLGIEDLVREVRIEPGANSITFGIPSTRTLLRASCRMSDDDLKTRTMVVGRVRGAGVGSPVAYATVQVWWSELIDPPVRGLVRNRTGKSSTRPDGWFAVCGVPSDATVFAQVASERDTSGVIPVRLTSDRIAYAAFTLGSARRVAVSDSTRVSGIDTVWAGSARIGGIVRDDRGQPVTSAEVGVVGTGRSTRSIVGGRFSMDSLPAGTQLVEVRAIEFEPLQLPVDLLEDATREVELKLPRRAVTLTNVEVRALAEQRVLEQFEYRRTRGTSASYFMQPEEIRRRPQDQSMARLIQEFPGVEVSCKYPHDCSVAMYRPSSHVSQSGRELCVPSLYIDGRRDQSDDFNQLDARHIVAVEVYPREVGRPSEFMDLHNNCGAVVFWTRRR